MTDIRKAGLVVDIISTPAHRQAIVAHLLQSHDRPKQVFVEAGDHFSRKDDTNSTLWIVSKGSIELEANGRLYKLRKDWFAYIPNGIEYTFHNRSNAVTSLVEQSGPMVDSSDSQVAASALPDLISGFERNTRPIGNRVRQPFARVTQELPYAGSPMVRVILAQAHPYAVMEAVLAIIDKENSGLIGELDDIVRQDSIRRNVPEETELPWAYELYRRGSYFWPMYVYQLERLEKAYIFAAAGLQYRVEQLGFTEDEIDEIYLHKLDEIFGIDKTLIIYFSCPSIDPSPEVLDEEIFYVLDSNVRAWSALISKFERAVHQYPNDIPIKPRYAIETFDHLNVALYEPNNVPSRLIDEATAKRIVDRTTPRNIPTIRSLMVENDRTKFETLMNKLIS
jgi:mannose-6-phosphate isomerase-like protein (cupin superfamily)